MAIPTTRLHTSLLLLFFLISFVLSAQGPQLEWAKRTGGLTFDDVGEDIHYDGDDGVFVSGKFYGTVDFDPGSGTYNLTSSGSDDIFIQKLDTAGNFVWARKVGGGDLERFSSVTTDLNGNVYVAGSFRSTADFDPGSGIFNLTSNGIYDLFILKLDSAGNFIWAKSIGGSNSETASNIQTDASGNVYVAGNFSSITDFDPGSGVQSIGTYGFGDFYVLKLDGSGNFVWATTIGGSSNDGVSDFVVDNSGNILLTGSFIGTVDFDRSTAGVAQRTSSGGPDGYILKLNSAGNFVWVHTFGGSLTDNGSSIAVDQTNNVYSLGYFSDTVDFDPGVGVDQLAANGNYDFAIQKLNSSGSYQWARGIGGTSPEIGHKIQVDQANNIYFTGTYAGTVDFNPGLATYNLTSAGSYDACVAKLSTNGGFIWAQTLGGTGYDGGNSIALDATADIYATGFFVGTADFDPSAGTSNLVSAGHDDVFTIKLGQCTVNGFDTIVACGQYTWIDGVTYTSSINGVTQLVSGPAGCDSLVTLNLTIIRSDVVVDQVVACDSLTWIDGVTYYSSNNTATDTLTNILGCDSIVSLDLTINPSKSAIDQITACGSYTWIDGNTYTSSNNSASYTLQTSAGCDSVIMLDLTINYPAQTVDQYIVCDSLTWINGVTYYANNNTAVDTLSTRLGCDSIVTLDLTVNYSQHVTDTHQSCGIYVWIDGITYTSSNNSASVTLQTSDGCDSIVTLDLTVTTIDTSLTVQDTAIMANQAGATYQWLDCQNGMSPITGETAADYFPQVNGVYAVEITLNGCVDTSSCVVIDKIGTRETHLEDEIYISPNPSRSTVHLHLGDLSEAYVSVFTSDGSVIHQDLNIQDGDVIFISDQAGLYFITIHAQGQTLFRKVLIAE